MMPMNLDFREPLTGKNFHPSVENSYYFKNNNKSILFEKLHKVFRLKYFTFIFSNIVIKASIIAMNVNLVTLMQLNFKITFDSNSTKTETKPNKLAAFSVKQSTLMVFKLH